MTRWLALVSSILALGLLAGCGGSSKKSSNNNGNSGGAAAPSKKQASSGGGAKTVQVAMKNIAFLPNAVTVGKGSTVKWTNQDSVNHDVTKTSGPGPKFSSGTGNLAKGDTYERKLTTAGTIKYVCTVHPGMEGTIVVK
jgi:plastocyanin